MEANVRKTYEKQRFLDAAPGGPRRHPATTGARRRPRAARTGTTKIKLCEGGSREAGKRRKLEKRREEGNKVARALDQQVGKRIKDSKNQKLTKVRLK